MRLGSAEISKEKDLSKEDSGVLLGSLLLIYCDVSAKRISQ
jgi:hypothetical protein